MQVNLFISGLEKYFASHMILMPEYFNNDYYEEDFYPEHYGAYAGSYAQDVEGLSDEFIDDVLGGDPDCYWNID